MKWEVGQTWPHAGVIRNFAERPNDVSATFQIGMREVQVFPVVPGQDEVANRPVLACK